VYEWIVVIRPDSTPILSCSGLTSGARQLVVQLALLMTVSHAVVHAVDDGRVHVLAAGRGDDHLLGAALDVGRGLLLGGEVAGALQHHVDPQLAPGQLGRVAVGEHADLVAVDHHVVAVDAHDAGELAVRGVVLRQVGVGLRVTQVVDGDDLDVVLLATFVVGAQHVAADAAIAIDGNFDGHGEISSLSFERGSATRSHSMSAV
jgi:hypothetical protein